MRAAGLSGDRQRDTGDVDIQTANGNFSLAVNGRELITRSTAIPTAGSWSFVVPTAMPLVQISGDSAGGSVKVTDADGQTKVDIHGKSRRHDSCEQGTKLWRGRAASSA